MVKTESIEFTWLDTRVRVESDSAPFTALVRRLWGLSGSHGREGATRAYRVELGPPSPGTFRGPLGPRELDAGEPLLHAYNLLVTDLLGAVGDHFVFHGTTVARDGEALVVSGPSTFGKTTLGIHLVERGFALVADDVTIVERASGGVRPFRRPLNLRSGTRSTIPSPRLRQAAAATLATEGEEWSVDPASWLDLAPGARRVAMVVLLRPDVDAEVTRRFPRYEIRLRRGRGAIRDGLESLDGIRRIVRAEGDPWLLYADVERSGALLDWLRSHRDDVVSAIKTPDRPSDFTGSPVLRTIGPFQAALELGQEMLNRHEGSRLAEEFSGRQVDLVAELAERLGGARCYALVPGRLDETIGLLISTFEEAR